MKIKYEALQRLFKEAIDGNKIIKERPWSVEYSFSLSGGTAEDSEGNAPDGFAIVMTGESGKTARVMIDTYWNPQQGDKSGNSIKIEVDGILDEENSTYVPVKFDDGKKQIIVISNSPVPGLVSVAHGPNLDDVPVVHAVFLNPFEQDEDVDFSVKNLGNGKAEVKLLRHTNE